MVRDLNLDHEITIKRCLKLNQRGFKKGFYNLLKKKKKEAKIDFKRYFLRKISLANQQTLCGSQN